MANEIECVVEYDGASRGNPGPGGAGAVLRCTNGGIIRVREGLGHTTNNVAEYRALNRALKVARDHGFKNIIVRGDSLLVHNQITGVYATNNQLLQQLQRKTRSLINNFDRCPFEHIPRERNQEADYEAGQAVYLREDEVQVYYS